MQDPWCQMLFFPFFFLFFPFCQSSGGVQAPWQQKDAWVGCPRVPEAVGAPGHIPQHPAATGAGRGQIPREVEALGTLLHPLWVTALGGAVPGGCRHQTRPGSHPPEEMWPQEAGFLAGVPPWLLPDVLAGGWQQGKLLEKRSPSAPDPPFPRKCLSNSNQTTERGKEEGS